MIPRETLQKHFARHFGREASLLSFAPGRINLMGEHVDYLGGKVLPAAINMGITVVGCADNSQTLQIHAKDLNESVRWTPEILQSRCPVGWQAYVWGVLQELKKTGCPWQGAHVLFSGDLPRGSGLSSSAALEVSMANFFLNLAHKKISSLELTQMAHRAEHLQVGTHCGIMDQYTSVHGKAQHFMVLDCSVPSHEYILADMGEHVWLLINSMVTHDLGDAYNATRKRSENDKSFYALGEFERTENFICAIRNKKLDQAGKLLTQTHWALSQKLKVSTPELDTLITAASKTDGWLGGRMMGGGFGGCTINLVVKEKLEAFTSETIRLFEEKYALSPEVYPVDLCRGCFIEKLIPTAG